MDEKDLAKRLDAWRVDDSVPRSFARDVWRALARDDREVHGFSFEAVRDWLSTRLSQPRFAAAALLGCIALSMLLAHLQAGHTRSRVENGLHARYVQSLDPFSLVAANSGSEMNKPLLVIVLAAAVSGAAFLGYLHCATQGCRSLARQPVPELAWLKKEFNLTDEQYRQISERHTQYRKDIAEVCRDLRQAENRLESALASNTAFPGQVEEAVLEAGAARTRCLSAMVKQLLDVGGSMNEEQRERYINMMISRVLYSKQQGASPCKH